MAPAPEDPSLLAAGGTDGVCGSLAAGHHFPQTVGGTPKPIPAPGRDRWLVTPSWGTHGAEHWEWPSRVRGASVADRSLGNSVEAIGSPARIPGVSAPGHLAGSWGFGHARP